MSSPFHSTHTIHIQNAPHRLYHSSPPGGPFIRHIHPNPYQINYHPPYYPFPPHFDSSVNLNNPYIYDPTHVKHRRRTTPEQLKVLEDTFKTDPKPNPALRKQLSVELGMSPRVLQVWFQNRRMKVKRLAKKQISASASASTSTDQDQDDDCDPSSAEVDSPVTPQEQDREPDHEHDSISDSPPPSLSTRSSVSDSDPGRNGSLSVSSSAAPTTATATTTATTIATSCPAPSSAVSAPIPTFDALPDTALYNNNRRRNSFASLHRLDSHPCISLLAASNSALPLPRPMHHHHSPSTPAPLRIVPPGMATRSASFHVLPTAPQYHTHTQQHAQHMHYPYAFPPRPLAAPVPGPLPAADYSFGTASAFDGNSNSAASGTEYLGSTEYVDSAGSDFIEFTRTSVSSDYTGSDFTRASGEYSRGTSGEYSRASGNGDYARPGTGFGVGGLQGWEEDTANEEWGGGGSRFGSIVSVGAGGEWDGQGRRGSCTGQVAEMLSTLEVGDKWDSNSYQQHHPAKEEQHHSLSHQQELVYPSDPVHVPLSKSSELAFALQRHGSGHNGITQDNVDKEMGLREQTHNHIHNHNDSHGRGQEQSNIDRLSNNGQDQRQHQGGARGNGQACEQGQELSMLHVPDGGELSPSTPTSANVRGVVGSMNHDQTDEVLEMHHALAGYMEGSGVAGYTMY
ncbi:hypothetical protein BU17DRAFT_65418 [Hysterangium stoloniferum]|nr:hypothetical protein BU17DRAFT_65418 [Hysterangium stoloniferum]